MDPHHPHHLPGTVAVVPIVSARRPRPLGTITVTRIMSVIITSGTGTTAKIVERKIAIMLVQVGLYFLP